MSGCWRSMPAMRPSGAILNYTRERLTSWLENKETLIRTWIENKEQVVRHSPAEQGEDKEEAER